MEQTARASESASTAVKRIIADLEECQPPQLGTLTDVVNTDELDKIIDPPPDETGYGKSEQSLKFRYCGYTLTAEDDGTIQIEK